MDAQDGQVPEPRRPRPLRALPSPDGQGPRVPELHALLGEIDALRLTLQTDLSLAAAAVEAGADDLAAELVEGDLGELRRFASSAANRLARLSDEVAPVEEDEVLPVSPLRRRRVLSGAPLMAAAAALIGFVAFVPGPGDVSPQTTMTSATIAGYELSRLASEGAPDEQLRLAAEELNQELAVLIAQAENDPVAAQQALMLLDKTTAVLSSQGDSGVLRSVIAETRALRKMLREALPVTAQRPARPSRPAVRTVVPLLPRVQEQPEKERSTSEPSSAAKSSPKPSPSPTSASPSPSPEPEPSQQPSSSPSPDQSQGPLPQSPGGQDLPGV